MLAGGLTISAGTIVAGNASALGTGSVTIADIVAGSAGNGVTLAPVTSWAVGTPGTNYSDVLTLTNTSGVAQVLSLTYDPTGLDQDTINSLELGWFDTGSQDWVAAIDGNSSGTPTFFSGSWADYLSVNPTATPTTALGVYGRDTATNTAWAVIDHNSDFPTACSTRCRRRCGSGIPGCSRPCRSSSSCRSTRSTWPGPGPG